VEKKDICLENAPRPIKEKMEAEEAVEVVENEVVLEAEVVLEVEVVGVVGVVEVVEEGITTIKKEQNKSQSQSSITQLKRNIKNSRKI